MGWTIGSLSRQKASPVESREDGMEWSLRHIDEIAEMDIMSGCDDLYEVMITSSREQFDQHLLGTDDP